MRVVPHKILLEKYFSASIPTVSVLISLYNYEKYIESTLNSLLHQTLRNIELVIVDDCSTDRSSDIALDWLFRNGSRFTRALLVKNIVNSGLSDTRNSAVTNAQADYIFILDADNVLLPKCLETHYCVLRHQPEYAFAYSIIAKFGAATGLMGTNKWSVDRLAKGNYIDAMALIRRDCLLSVGGYKKMNITGWEDYELWCRFAERGWMGARIPEILAKYRVHENSMLRTITTLRSNSEKLRSEMRTLHPWVLSE
jgi:glycosyltransferase involved in cell wall biosynthesis